MTASDKENILQMREKGTSYSEISRLLGLNENNVSSYCRRHGLGGRKKRKDSTENIIITHCLECNGIVRQNPHRKAKKFCSDKCRMKWWNSHPQMIQKKSLSASVCPVCGIEFKAYKSSHKKYCSRKCYGKSKGNAA